MDYILSPLAEQDLEDIWHHIAFDNELAADGVIRKIFDSIEILTQMPLLGRAREELLPEMRSFGVYPYILFYKSSSEEIEIIRILHGARDIDGLFH